MYNQRSARVRQKDPAPVTIRTIGEDAFDGEVFIAIGHRLVDLLNDDRGFIPVRRDDGDMMILAKSHIVSIIEHDVADSDAASDDQIDAEADVEAETSEGSTNSANPGGRKFDPYALLKLDPAASTEEVRAAYKSRIKLIHPDSVAALGLDDDLAEAALRATQKLNYAYQKIMRERNDIDRSAKKERASA